MTSLGAAVGLQLSGCAIAADEEASASETMAATQACKQASEGPHASRKPWTRKPLLAEGTAMYVPQGWPASQQAARYGAEGLAEEAALMNALASHPQVVYLAFGAPEEIGAYVDQTITKAQRQRQVAVFAVYNVPGRDCSQYSAGGTSSEEEYRAWIDGIAAAVGHRKAVMLLEPDGVALLPSEPWCGVGGGGFSGEPERLDLVEERFRELRYAVERFGALPRVDVYLDAGHSAWHPLNDYDAYYGEPHLQYGIVHRLMLAGIERARGFFLNPSNYRSTESLIRYGERVAKCVGLLAQNRALELPPIYEPDVTYDESGAFASPCPSNEVLDSIPLTPRLTKHMPHFVLDTSRNGQGPWLLGDPEDVNDDAAAFESLYGFTSTDPEIWCNAPGRGVGPRPTTRTGHPLVDAFVWIKVPGESDGQCRRNLVSPDPSWPENYDVAWHQVDPPAGQWFEAQALELAKLAEPPLLP